MPTIDQQVMQQILKSVATVRDGSKQLMGKMTMIVRMLKKHDSKIERLEKRVSELGRKKND